MKKENKTFLGLCLTFAIIIAVAFEIYNFPSSTFERLEDFVMSIEDFIISKIQNPSDDEYLPATTTTVLEFSSEEEFEEYLRKENEKHQEYVKTSMEESAEIISRASELPYQQLITTSYPEEDLAPHIFLGYLSYISVPISELDKRHPIECIRLVDENSAYTIHKTNENGLLYTFYYKYDEEYPNWHYSHSISMKKNLKLTNFKTIILGSSWKKVNRIDPIVNAHREADDGVSVHLLQDGVLVVEYFRFLRKLQIVKRMDFYPDFIAHAPRKGVETYDCRILPQDFIQ
ncbi:MAG: hypothetical protein FWG82_01020 [Oscillospiraceae bacterium]|nr:hypothetical protein [Oscillospiraceae bacterium]